MRKVIQIYTKFNYLKFRKHATRGPYCFLWFYMSFIFGFWLSVQLESHADFNIFLFCLKKVPKIRNQLCAEFEVFTHFFLRSCSLDRCRRPRDDGHEPT
jgi:hypothetical protein